MASVADRAAAVAAEHGNRPGLEAAVVAAQEAAVVDYIAEQDARRARPTEIRSPILRRHGSPQRPKIR